MDETAQQKNIFWRFLILSVAAISVPVILIAPQGQTQSTPPAEQGSSAQLAGARDAKARDEEIRDQMIVISRHLGVNCLTCHETDNFASNKKVEFKIAREHMRLVQVLIDNGFNGQGGNPKADCYLCHRGELKPNYKEPHDPLIMGKSKKNKSSN